jgi:arabinose-5-phosphate isomerase
MHPLDKVAFVKKSDSLKDIVISMTRYPLGAAVVLDDKDSLLGIITDGDVRRALQKYDDIRSLTAQQVMISKPVVIKPEDSLSEAADCMEKRSSQISVLPVIDKKGRCLGLIRIHDIYQANI